MLLGYPYPGWASESAWALGVVRVGADPGPILGGPGSCRFVPPAGYRRVMTTPRADDWPCDAYGPPDPGVTDWPLCFFAGSGRACATHDVCATRMADERRRVYATIQDGASRGDETMQYLAQQFTSPDQLLGGPGSSE